MQIEKFNYDQSIILRKEFNFEDLKKYESYRWPKFKRNNSHILKKRLGKGIKDMTDFYDCLGISFDRYAQETGKRLNVQQIRMNPKTNEKLKSLICSNYREDNLSQCAIIGDWVNFSPKDDESLPENVIEIDRDHPCPVEISEEELENIIKEREAYYGITVPRFRKTN